MIAALIVTVTLYCTAPCTVTVDRYYPPGETHTGQDSVTFETETNTIWWLTVVRQGVRLIDHHPHLFRYDAEIEIVDPLPHRVFLPVAGG